MEEQKQEYQLVTIEEMREMVKSKAYNIPKEDEQYPLELQKEEETGNLYTDYFVDFKEDILISHLLVEQLFASFDDVDWRYVTYNFNPHIIARICSLYRYPLTWMEIPDEWKGRVIVEGRLCRENYRPAREDANFGYFSVDLVRSERALFFAKELPYFQVGENEAFLLNKPIHDWPLILADFDAMNFSALRVEDPYFTKEAFPIFKRNTFTTNLTIVRDELGVNKALEIIQLLRDEWKYISTLHLWGYEDNDEDAKDLQHFLFVELDLYLEEWTAETKEDSSENSSETPKTCRYICAEKIAESGFRTVEEYTNMLSDACAHANKLAAFLNQGRNLGFLRFHGEGKSNIYNHLKECFPGKIKFGYANFTQYFS